MCFLDSSRDSGAADTAVESEDDREASVGGDDTDVAVREDARDAAVGEDACDAAARRDAREAAVGGEVVGTARAATAGTARAATGVDERAEVTTHRGRRIRPPQRLDL